MTLIIDRFEGNFAICENEDGEFISIGRDRIPASAREGDALEKATSEKYEIDAASSQALRQSARDLLDALLSDDEQDG